MRRLVAPIQIYLPLLLLIGCSTSSNQSPLGLPMTDMQVGSKTYHLELATDDASREHGLMERDEMAGDHGMVFIFTSARVQNFWMKNTRFPLDIVFADDNAKVVSTHTMKPYDLTGISSDAPAKYAIELNAGEVAADGVKVGDPLSLPPAVLNAHVN